MNMKQAIHVNQFASALLVCAVLHGLPFPASAETDGKLRLVLHQAFVKTPEPQPDSPTAIVTVTREDKSWGLPVATAVGFNQHEHIGHVVKSESAGGGLQLGLEFQVRGDAWVPGGKAQFEVNLIPGADNRLEGRFTGVIRGVAVAGRAEAEWVPVSAEAQPPVGFRKHPRLLFRAEDLPALRLKAKTRLGQLALEQLPEGPAASAFRYALTGDASQAADARRRLEALMQDREHGGKMALSRMFGWRLEQAALAFDLCYDAWDVEFRRTVSEFLCDSANMIMHNRGMFVTSFRWGHRGPHAPTLYYAAAMAGLAIADEPGPAPTQPEAPVLIGPTEGRLAAVQRLANLKGVPVWDFANDTMPLEWIHAGAFPAAKDPLPGSTQRGDVRPVLGAVLGTGEQARPWRVVEPEKLLSAEDPPRLLITGPVGVVVQTISYYYCVLRNDRVRWVRVQTGHGGVEMYLNGARVLEGDTVQLEPGLYPWLVTAPMGQMNPWAKSWANPRLIEVDEAEVADRRTAARESLAEETLLWKRELERWERLGGVNGRYQIMATTARHLMDLVYSEMLGRGGFLSGGAELVGMDGPNKYAFVHRNATGQLPGFAGEVADYLVRSMFVHPYRADRSVFNQEINGRSGFVTGKYPEGGRDLAAEHFATLYPLIRPDWQPAVLWAWHYHTGGSAQDDASLVKLLKAPQRNYPFTRPYGSFDTLPIYAFLNYPLDLQPSPPQGILPLTWAAPDFGFYGFRNQWTDDARLFIVQFFSATHEAGAGTLRVNGLGQVWSHSLEDQPSGARFFENVVQLPHNEINDRARATVTAWRTEPDGSGQLALDLAPVYSAPVLNENGRPRSLYTELGRFPVAGAFGKSKVTGGRLMAVDFSGKSGAPCVIVLVDTLRGAERPVWSWQLNGLREGYVIDKLAVDFPDRESLQARFKDVANGTILLDRSEPSEDPRVRIEKDGFSLTQGGASMRATFLAPVQPKVEVLQRIRCSKQNVEVLRVDRSTSVCVSGADFFFTVLTFQEGDAPPVQVTRGRGMNLVAQVGGQSISFDGQTIQFKAK